MSTSCRKIIFETGGPESYICVNIDYCIWIDYDHLIDQSADIFISYDSCCPYIITVHYSW